jgi:hypothetical protein
MLGENAAYPSRRTVLQAGGLFAGAVAGRRHIRISKAAP